MLNKNMIANILLKVQKYSAPFTQNIFSFIYSIQVNMKFSKTPLMLTLFLVILYVIITSEKIKPRLETRLLR